MDNFKKRYKKIKKKVENRIIYHLKHSNLMNGIPDKLKRAIEYTLLAGGKRLRPILALMVADLMADWIKSHDKTLEISNQVEEIALAIEMIHTYSLIHDDLPAMDNDELRRGNPTCHIKFDEATAILTGDALLNQSYELLSSINNKQIGKVISLIAQAVGARGMIGGQMLDMDATGKNITQKELEKLHQLKTGKLIKCSVLAPVVFYQIEELLEKLGVFGEKLGLAFQIMDDVLEVTQNCEILGKNVNSDINNDKSTFVKLLGVIKAKEYATNLVIESCSIIDSIELDYKSESQANLRDIANFIIQRTN